MSIIFWTIFIISFMYCFIMIFLELLGVVVDVYYNVKKERGWDE